MYCNDRTLIDTTDFRHFCLNYLKDTAVLVKIDINVYKPTYFDHRLNYSDLHVEYFDTIVLVSTNIFTCLFICINIVWKIRIEYVLTTHQLLRTYVHNSNWKFEILGASARSFKYLFT